jgi:hypothetical protein
LVPGSERALVLASALASALAWALVSVLVSVPAWALASVRVWAPVWAAPSRLVPRYWRSPESHQVSPEPESPRIRSRAEVPRR